MGFYGTMLAHRRLALFLAALALAHLLLVTGAAALIIYYQQMWAIAGVLWLPLTVYPLRWTTAQLKRVFMARDDDVLASNGVAVESPSPVAARERLTNICEEIAVAVGEEQPRAALCQSPALNAFVALPEQAGRQSVTVVFSTAMAGAFGRNELQAVAAHLYARRGGFERLFAGMAAAMYLAVFITADLFLALTVLNWNYGGSGDFTTGPLVVLLAAGMLGPPVWAAALARAYILRRFCLLADLEALKITHDPESLMGVLAKLEDADARLTAAYDMANVWLYFESLDDPRRRYPWQRLATHPRPAARLNAIKTAAGRV